MASATTTGGSGSTAGASASTAVTSSSGGGSAVGSGAGDGAAGQLTREQVLAALNERVNKQRFLANKIIELEAECKEHE